MSDLSSTQQNSENVELPRRGRRAPQGARKYMLESEVEAFFKVVKSPRDRALFRVMSPLGWRASEIGVLDMKHFTMADGRPPVAELFVTRKKRSVSRGYQLNEATAAAMRAWLKVRGVGPGPIFLSRNHRAIERTTVWRLTDQYGAQAGIPEGLR